jgi:hypothetical protein
MVRRRPWEVFMQKERVWCGPTEKFKQQGTLEMKVTVVRCPILPSEGWVPSPEGCGRHQTCGWSCLLATRISCQVGLRTPSPVPLNHMNHEIHMEIMISIASSLTLPIGRQTADPRRTVTHLQELQPGVSVARWVWGPRAQGFHITWFLKPPTPIREVNFWVRYENTLTCLWELHPGVCLKTMSADLPNHMTSTVSSSPQRDEMLGRAWEHWDTPLICESWHHALAWVC